MYPRLRLIALLILAFSVTAAVHADEPLTVPWNGIDLGSPIPAGSATEKNGDFTVAAGGSGFIGAFDRFHFVYQSFTGDFSLIVRVDSVAYAGVMVRDALAANSNFAAALRTPNGDVLFAGRTPKLCRPRLERCARQVEADRRRPAYRIGNGLCWSVPLRGGNAGNDRPEMDTDEAQKRLLYDSAYRR